MQLAHLNGMKPAVALRGRRKQQAETRISNRDIVVGKEESGNSVHAKVLVVDDDYMNIEVLTSMLTNRRIKSDIALNGK